MNSKIKTLTLAISVVILTAVVTFANGQITQLYPAVNPGPLVEYSNGILSINRRVVDRCFWWDNGRYQLNRRNNEIFVNNRRIPDYFTHNLPGVPPPCPGHSGASSLSVKGSVNAVILTVATFLAYKLIL